MAVELRQHLLISELQEIFYEFQSFRPNWNKIGKITKEGQWNHLVNGLTHNTQPRLLVLVEKVNRTLACLEQKGIKVFDPTIMDAKYLEKARSYRLKRQIHLDLAEAIETHISQLKHVSPELKKACHELQWREVSLRYFLGKENGGLDSLDQADPDLLLELQQRAEDWKKSQSLAVHKELNDLDELQLEELAKYPEWLKVVLEDPQHLKDVFSWTLLNFNNVEALVKCPETVGKINDALLKSNVGYVRNLVLTSPDDEVLAFRTMPTKVNQVGKRVLTASIYHGDFWNFEPDQQERVNILKPTEVIHFKQGHYILTVEEFFKELGQKDLREANISLCGDWGFVNFHPVKGMWDADEQCYKTPDMTKDDFFKYVPASRFASHDELVAQFGDKIKDREFFFKVMATRKSLDLNALDCHAFWQLYCRMDDGNWKVISPGAYAYRFPQSLVDGLWLFCATVKAVLCWLDQNCYYTHRQRGGLAFFPTDDEQSALLSRIYHLMFAKRVFQFSGRNCAHCVQSITHEIMQNKDLNFFFVALTQCKTGVGPLDRILAWAHHQWEWVRWLVISMLQTLFLSHRNLDIQRDEGMVNYSVREFFSKNGYNIFNPSYLPYQIAEAHETGQGPFVDGELYWSHTDEKLFQAKVINQQDQLSEEDSDEADI